MAPTRYVAHRGGAALWPENSLLAFKNAIAAGARLLEMDVHQAADGTVVVIHDPTLDRTTNGTGPVAAHTSAELRALRLRDTSGALTQEWVPTLAEVLALAAPVGVALLVEIKTPGPAVQYVPSEDGVRVTPGPRYEGLEQRILRIVPRGCHPCRGWLGGEAHGGALLSARLSHPFGGDRCCSDP